MDEAPVFAFVRYNFLLIAFAVVVKLSLYYLLQLKKPQLKTFLYFSDNDLLRTKDLKRKKKKSFQNTLSIIIIFLILMQILVFLGGAFIRHRPVDL